MGLATVALVLAAGLAACLVCGPPAAEAGPLLSERGLSATMSEGGSVGGPLTDSSNAGATGPESRRPGRKNGRKPEKKKKGRGGAGKRVKCKTPECKRDRREKRKRRRKQKKERKNKNKKSGGGGKGRGGKKRRGEQGGDAPAVQDA